MSERSRVVGVPCGGVAGLRGDSRGGENVRRTRRGPSVTGTSDERSCRSFRVSPLGCQSIHFVIKSPMPGWQAQARFLTESPPRWAAEAAAGVVATGGYPCPANLIQSSSFLGEAAAEGLAHWAGSSLRPNWSTVEAAEGVLAMGAGLCRHPLESYRRFRPPAARVVPAGVDESSDRPC